MVSQRFHCHQRRVAPVSVTAREAGIRWQAWMFFEKLKDVFKCQAFYMDQLFQQGLRHPPPLPQAVESLGGELTP